MNLLEMPTTTTEIIINVIYLILETIFFLIFLEIIELNFCKLNYNLKRKIEERAINEKIYNVNDEDQKIFIDEESKYYIKTELFSEK